MKKMWCNDVEFGKEILYPKTNSMNDADVKLYILNETMYASDILNYLLLVKGDPIRSYVCPAPGSSEAFTRQVNEVFKEYTTNMYTDWDRLKGVFLDGVQELLEYNIRDCIIKSAKNYDKMVTDEEIGWVEDAVKYQLKKHSAYTCALALQQMFRKDTQFLSSTYETIVKYYADVYRDATLADENYKNTRSHLLSVLAIGNTFYNGEHAEEYEKVCLHTLFEPYRDGDFVRARANVIIELVKGRKKTKAHG